MFDGKPVLLGTLLFIDSPFWLLCILTEPLAAAVLHQEGIETDDVHHEISLYADDILLYLQVLSSTLPKIIKLNVKQNKKNVITDG